MAVETGTGATGRVAPAGHGSAAVAASLLAVMLIGGYFASSAGGRPGAGIGFVINAVVLAVAFWFPALRIGSMAELVRGWRPLGVWLLAWTLVWDLATAGLTLDRAPFQEWWLVYPAGVLCLTALLALNAVIVSRVQAD